MENTKIDISTSFKHIIIDKIQYYNNILNDTVMNCNTLKQLKILSSNQQNSCVSNIESINSLINTINIENCSSQEERDNIIDKLQECNDKICDLFKVYGTNKIDYILNICFGSKYVDKELIPDDTTRISKYNLINRYCIPIEFKIMPWKNSQNKNSPTLNKSHIIDDHKISEYSNTLECFDVAMTQKNFYSKVYGFKICFQNKELKKSILITCIAQNIIPFYINNRFIKDKINSIKDESPINGIFENREIFNNFIHSLSLKDIFVYSNKELYNRYSGFINHVELIKKNSISKTVKEFVNSDLYSQRLMLIQLLIHNNNSEHYYLAYLLYDLLSNDDKSDSDVIEQTTIYDSLPWNIKQIFKKAMKSTIDYTKQLVNIDNNKIPIEQQICLMKVSDTIKEKAMTKLKEVKAKTEDSGSKARQYLDGLLKIPFGIYKQEPILSIVNECSDTFKYTIQHNNLYDDLQLVKKERYTTLEVKTNIEYIEKSLFNEKSKLIYNEFITYINEQRRKKLINITIQTNDFIKKNNISYRKIIHSAKKNEFLINSLITFYDYLYNTSFLFLELYLSQLFEFLDLSIFNIKKYTVKLNKKWENIGNSIKQVNNIMNDAVYGHTIAKRQIERVIGQWMTGEQKGYCFGFEGPPGVGKTSIAKKGIAKCLIDDDGNPRPFGFIALGGSSNSSTLDGHNYTYVGSTWGRIVDILIESKCMNPIIFIDELDKISKTEQGKEIIGILTHIVDPTQNNEFHDKYFSGVDIDLSKVLFIFSYNDVNLIDKILLDRIHRVKFNNLNIDEKIIICKKYLLPEIFKQFNLDNSIQFDDYVLKFIIETYTQESGVRKLKEILFEIISEINLEILQNKPIQKNICEDILIHKYLKERTQVKEKIIHIKNEVGVINGLWANSLGQGGIIPIQTTFFPSNTLFELKLTGMQGDVMKESMEVAKTLAYSLTTKQNKEYLSKDMKETGTKGIHIHCPEGAVPKDGPSAGTAITITIYSLLNNIKIKNNVAITGEINLQGNVTAIGGLELKILGGIKAGVKEFIFPSENKDDFIKIKDKYDNKECDNDDKDSDDDKTICTSTSTSILDGITFHQVNHISEVIKLVFE